MFEGILENVRKRAPRIHCITNFVTMNDCANMLLACGASPIMAFDEAETAEIAAQCDGLVINMGTLRREAVPAMLAAGKRANALGRPVVLDPVGAGASDFRTETALRLMEEIRFACIRGNASELRALSAACEQEWKLYERSSGASHSASGVDADVSDRVTDENLDNSVAFEKAFSKQTGAVTAMTGAIDIVADGGTAVLIRNGHPMMSRVTGTGCQLSAVTAAFLAANNGDRQPSAAEESGLSMADEGLRLDCGSAKRTDESFNSNRNWNYGKDDDRNFDRRLFAAAAAVCAMGLCGERAYDRLTGLDGNATYRNYIIDAMFRLTPGCLEQEAKAEIR
ncbi:MAG: hydroxyethylthiazole kinase [Lachnospiraceae bacterium]|nr:hydroxyethylthiazole kinase [Lachnospiraceae bacterium]